MTYNLRTLTIGAAPSQYTRFALVVIVTFIRAWPGWNEEGLGMAWTCRKGNFPTEQDA